MAQKWVVWRSGNGAGHINKIKLHRAQLVLGFAFRHSPRSLRPIQPGYPSIISRCKCNEYWWWFQPPMGKKRRVLRSSRPCNQDCWHTGLRRALANLSPPPKWPILCRVGR